MNFLYNPTMLFAAASVFAAAVFLLRGPRVMPWLAVRFLLAVLCLFPAFMFYASSVPSDYVRLITMAVASLAFFFIILDFFYETFLRIVAAIRRGFSKNLPGYMAEICDAAEKLASAKVGALIVVEKRDDLAQAVEGGIFFDADVKAEILAALFAVSSPVHDGAVIVTDGRISRVKVILPLGTGTALPMGVGTRHRAAAGLTEKTDAVTIAVSEERGEISVAYRGLLTRVTSRQELEKTLLSALKMR